MTFVNHKDSKPTVQDGKTIKKFFSRLSVYYNLNMIIKIIKDNYTD
jgi:hypothetical protein